MEVKNHKVMIEIYTGTSAPRYMGPRAAAVPSKIAKPVRLIGRQAISAETEVLSSLSFHHQVSLILPCFYLLLCIQVEAKLFGVTLVYKIWKTRSWRHSSKGQGLSTYIIFLTAYLLIGSLVFSSAWCIAFLLSAYLRLAISHGHMNRWRRLHNSHCRPW